MRSLQMNQMLKTGRLMLALALPLLWLASHPHQADAGHQFFRQNSVGGISVDALGVVDKPNVEAAAMLRRDMIQSLKKVPGDLNGKTELRKISLRGLEQAIADAELGILPDEVKYLAGLQRIEYVLVYPEENDIILAGPGEGWTVDAVGNVVGATTGRPVLQLDDLLVALRSVDDARREGITCSIDPTAEGRQRLNQLFARLKQFDASVPKRVEEALGPQKITLTGVPPTSHFARVLVAADYRMKRYAMHLDESPVEGLPSYISMSKGREGNMMPRWWLACNYDAIAKSPDGLAWQLRGPGVKCMTEEDFVDAEGRVEGAGKADPIAQRWADTFTAKYDALSQHDKVFGELRNIMDMCVVAALIKKERLFEKASCSVPMLTEKKSELALDSWNPPKQIATQSSALKVGRKWVITASGGVEVDSWAIADRSVANEAAAQVHKKASRPQERDHWWWN